jgi:hypothetical protein
MQAELITQERQIRNLIYRPNAVHTKALVEFLLDNCCGGQSCLPKPHTRKVKAQ